MTLPPFLKPGDTVAVVAPASPMPYAEVQPGLELLRSNWGLNVWEGPHLQASIGGFAGTDAQRLADLQTALDDPNIRAVLAARGGYGSYRLLENLDFATFRRHPKWLVGFSDITALLNQAQVHNVVALHAAMPRQFGQPEQAESVEMLRRWLFGEPVEPYVLRSHPLNRQGNVAAPLTGGNLSLLLHLLATPSEVDWAGKILFIEDVGETPYVVDRALLQLRRSGRLAGLAGLLIGHFSEMRGTTLPFGLTVEEIIAEHVADYTFPVAFHAPVGHEPPNFPFPVGLNATLTVTDEGAVLRAVAVGSGSWQ